MNERKEFEEWWFDSDAFEYGQTDSAWAAWQKGREVLATQDVTTETRAPTQADQDRLDAARYRWLRDVSAPPHNFYLSVPIEFDGIRYTRAEVDAYIDGARSRDKP